MSLPHVHRPAVVVALHVVVICMFVKTKRFGSSAFVLLLGVPSAHGCTSGSVALELHPAVGISVGHATRRCLGTG